MIRKLVLVSKLAQIVFNFDYESTRDGTLTVVDDAVVVTNNGKVMVTAWDIDLQG